MTPAQLSVPGSERASAISLSSESMFRLAGTDMATMVLDTRVIGTRSLGLYGRLSCRNGCAVNDEVGANNST